MHQPSNRELKWLIGIVIVLAVFWLRDLFRGFVGEFTR